MNILASSSLCTSWVLRLRNNAKRKYNLRASSQKQGTSPFAYMIPSKQQCLSINGEKKRGQHVYGQENYFWTCVASSMDSRMDKPIQGHQWQDTGSMCQAKMQVQKTSYLKLDYICNLSKIRYKKKLMRSTLEVWNTKNLYINKLQANMWLTKTNNTTLFCPLG